MIAPLKHDSKREQFLLMLFPAALILAIYSVLFAVPLRSQRTKIEANYQQQKLSAVSEETARFSEESLLSEKESLERTRKRVSQSKQRIRELSIGWRSGKSRIDTLEKITELMRDYNLSIVSQGGEDSVVVSTYLKDMFAKMNEQSVGDPVEFWPVEIKGAYFDVLEFLSDVNILAKSIIPVAITMQPESAGGSQRTWTIVFVI
ncbi:hypothetical protein [Mariniblastus fucicola]|uniref:Pilus assembly protein, PilO n=1 Tax=Mariniblastus fucicola TaxID=980251 RepID=A0A5B9PKB4_9BACT|nr:hypothetical protein [Mariniblastus fucicola]QEG23101.1 hypothetical protein MFFC18_29960 [Mariniblastus fucicola]